MDAPDELRQAIRDAIYRAPIGSAADAVLAVPAIADAIRKAAMLDRVEAIVNETDLGLSEPTSDQDSSDWRNDAYERIAGLL